MFKKMMLIGFLAAFLQGITFAEDATSSKKIPVLEHEFVKAMKGLNKEKIVAQLGEPAKKEDVTNKKDGKIVASVWHYHNLNTDVLGKYYPTTELDFAGENVEVVVFMNNEGVEMPYTEPPQEPEDAPLPNM